ncbi:MAG: hypothetical protein ACO1TE_07375 [Prosthecobacter sp.]
MAPLEIKKLKRAQAAWHRRSTHFFYKLMKTICILSPVLMLSLAAMAAGPLTPPGAPAPTMKTLSEIEPRKLISSLPFGINEPGSYYLAGDLTGTGGILIAADNVTLDLAGFTLKGTATSGSGIKIGSESLPRKNITIKNGMVTGWQFYGVDGTYGTSVVLENISGSGNRSGGAGNGGGCVVGTSSVVRSCSFSEGVNSGNGFEVMGRNNKFTGCHVTGGFNGVYSILGFNSFVDCTFQDCARAGISAWACDVVRQCEVINCNLGVEIGARGVVKGCAITSNGGSGGGVTTLGVGAVVEANTVAGYAIGIQTASGSTGGLIIKNVVSLSSVRNFEIIAGNKVAEIVSAPASGAISGNTGGAGVGTSTNPWANISY